MCSTSRQDEKMRSNHDECTETKPEITERRVNLKDNCLQLRGLNKNETYL